MSERSKENLVERPIEAPREVPREAPREPTLQTPVSQPQILQVLKSVPALPIKPSAPPKTEGYKESFK